MSSSARKDIFARLRHLGSGLSGNDIWRERQALGHAPQPSVGTAGLLQSFIRNVERNHGSVDAATERVGAVKAVGRYLYAQYRSHRIVAGSDPRLAAMPWRDAGVLPRFGSVEQGEPAALSFAQLGVAEIGAVVTCTGKANPAANNLLPEHHIVLVEVADIVHSMEDAWQRLNSDMERSGRPRGINFIAGPSSTADIEGQLVYGAHGPRQWHVIVVGEGAVDALASGREDA